MKRSFFVKLLGIFSLIGLSLSPVGALPVLAQDGNTLQPAPALVKLDSPGQVELSFADLHMTSPQALPGPVSEYSLRFNLPADWVPAGPVDLDLELSAFFSGLLPTENNGSVSGLVGGNLSVSLNGSVLGVKTLQQSGDQTIQYEFDSSLLTLPARTSYNELRVRWDGTSSCLMNLLTSVTIMPSSKFMFSYTENTSPLSLNSFPVPFIIENPLKPIPLILLLPASPAQSEMQAALIISAGIGQLSGGTLGFEMVPLDKYTPTLTDMKNVILIATSDKLGTPELQALGLPTQIKAGKAEGIIHLFQTSTRGYGLLISGDEAGIIKAAQVASANQVIAVGDAMTMIVSAINPPTSSVGKEDTTMQDLGVGEMLLTHQAGLDQSFDFYIPAGQQASPDSSFGLIISHSQQLDYLRSGLQVKLNGFPVASLRFSDSTADQSLFQLILPSNLIHTGRNTVALVAELNTRDLCGQPDDSVAWLSASANSLLHLPLEKAVTSSVVAKVFKDFPDLFLSGSNLDNVTFVLPSADFGSLQAAGKLAYQLGEALPHSELMQLHITWSDKIDPALTSGANLILVGKPLDFTTLADKNQFPSLAFTADNTLSAKSTLAMVTKTVTGTDVGYLAIRGYANGTDQVLMAVLGNSSTGINLAVDTISRPDVGLNNFAMVVGEGVQASWLDQGISTGEIVQSSALATEVPTGANTTQQFKQSMLVWVLPVMAALLIVLTLFLFIELRRKMLKR